MMTYKVHHIALSVKDLDAAIAFYAIFGFREVLRWQATDGSLVISHIGIRKEEPMLELFAYRDGLSHSTSASDLETDLKQVGVRHFALGVTSVTSAYSALQAAGIIPACEVRAGRTGVSYFFVRDPDGNYVEVVQDDRELLD